MRLDKNKDGTIDKEELKAMAHSSLDKMYDVDWDKIIKECDQTGNGVLDFQEFISACISRKAITNKD